MTKVDFYVVHDGNPAERLRIACRVCEKAYHLGHQIHIHTDCRELCTQLDELLWTFRDRSFIPHVIEPQDASEWPLTLGYNWDPEKGEVLINLANDVPQFFNQFERVAEIVGQDKHARDSARKRYGFYRDHGCDVRHHTIYP